MGNVRDSSVDICILIPCYNNIEGLVRSVNSIVYNHSGFMVLVVDDGSRVPVTIDALRQHIPLSVNIQIIRLAQNEGIIKALNTGLDYIYQHYNSRFIARLDCGDICDPERFNKQVFFLENNSGTDLLGTWCYFKDMNSGATYQYITPVRHDIIQRSMYFRNVFVHPTVMWRVAALNTYRYPEKYPHAEDYGLFYDIISTKNTAIINEFLVTCEINRQGISFLHRAEQLKSRLSVIWDYGQNKFWLSLGTIKLAILMALPYQLIYNIKKQVFKFTPGSKPDKIKIL